MTRFSLLRKRVSFRNNLYQVTETSKNLIRSYWYCGIFFMPTKIYHSIPKVYIQIHNVINFGFLFYQGRSNFLSVVISQEPNSIYITTVYGRYTPSCNTIFLINFILSFFEGESVYSAAIIVLLLSVFATMIICYYIIVKVVKETSIVRNQSREFSRHVKVAKAIALIIICFCFLFTPIAIFMGLVSVSALPSVQYKGFSGQLREIFYAIGMSAAMANSALNPAIYYLRMPEIRESLTQFLNLKSSKGSISTEKRVSSMGESQCKRTEESSFQENASI